MISEKVKRLTDQELRATTVKIAAYNRKVEAAFVEHIAEIFRRRAFSAWGFTSLYHYLTTELKYSGSAAYRRIEAAKMLLQIPELKHDLENGALNLSQICTVQKALKKEKNENGPVPIEERRDLFSELRNKTCRETEKIIDRTFEFPLQQFPVEAHKRDDSVELTIRLSKDLYEQLTKVKMLYSHIVPDGNWHGVLEKMASDVIAKRDPMAKAPRKLAAIHAIH